MKRKFLISNFEFLILTFILIVAGFFRFYQLNRVPPSPSLDEVSIGWNAYSILKTGQDEYGTRFPVLLRAYDDWRPAGYVYLVIPFVKLFGLFVLAVRLPSVLFSLLTVLIAYFLVKELFFAISPPRSPFGHLGGLIKELFADSLRRSPSTNSGHHSRCLGLSLTASFLLAISPWHIYISRLGHEVNAGLAFSVLAIYLFIKSINRKKGLFLLFSAIFFSLSFYTYQSQKLFIPLVILALVMIFRERLLTMRKSVVLAGLLGLILLIPIVIASLPTEARVRFQATSLWSHKPEIQQRAAQRIARDYQKSDFLGLIFDNRRAAAVLAVLRNYFSHFDPAWLFFNVGEEKHKVPSLGVLYLWELPLLLIGGYKLATGKFPKTSKLLIFSWLLVAPLPASLTTEAPHVMRTFNILPMPQILAALGIVAITTKIKSMTRKYLKNLIFTLCFLFLLFNFFFLFHNYFINFPYEQSDSFQYPLAQAIDYVLKNEDRYQKIVFSNQDHCYQSYMFWLFFSKYDPEVYLSQGGTISGGYDEMHQIGKYEFRPIEWGKEEKSKKVLYVGNFDDFSSDTEPLQIFKLLNNQEAIKVVRGEE